MCYAENTDLDTGMAWSNEPRQTILILIAYASNEGSGEPAHPTPLLAHTSSESRGTFRQKAGFLAALNDWACAVKIYHDGMLEDTIAWRGPYDFIFVVFSKRRKHLIFLSFVGTNHLNLIWRAGLRCFLILRDHYFTKHISPANSEKISSTTALTPPPPPNSPTQRR